jgi:hypothetical protein
MNHKAIILITTLCISIKIDGQVVVRDFQFWPSIKVNKEVGNKWSVSLENQIRLYHDAKKFDENITEAGLDFSPVKSWQLSLGFREIRHRTGSGDIENRIRIHADAEYMLEIDRLEARIRARIQSRSDEDEDQLLNDFRTRLMLEYNIPSWKLDPFIYEEVDFRLPGRESFGYHSFRLVFGAIWKISALNRLRFFYMFERERQKYFPFTANRIGIEYQIRL